MHGLDLGFFRRARVPLILQSEAAECGLACIAMLAGFHCHHVNLPELRQRWRVSLKGLALHGMMDVARCLGLEPRALRLECHELRQLRLPCILHWKMNHFVVLERVTAAGVRIADPALGRRRLSRRQCSGFFTGVALEVQPDRDFRRKNDRQQLTLADLLRGNGTLLAPLAQVLALSIAIQVFALAMPAYLQLAIDQAVLSRDRQLLILLAIAFALVAVVHAVTTAFRAWCVFYFGTRLNFSWTSGLFHWLLRQPLDFFEKRSVGDIQSRFGSVEPLRELISTRTVEVIVDGLMAATTGIVIVLYGRTIGIAVLASIALYAGVRLAMFSLISQRSREQLIANAAAESFLLESIRGALTIKNFGIERQRLALYRHRIANAFNAAARVRRLSVVENSMELAIFSLQGVAIVFIGVSDIIAGNMSVGVLVALLAYSSQFSGRSVNLIHGLLQFRLIRIHLDRIADIVHASPEPAAEISVAGDHYGKRLAGTIEVDNLWFRYNEHDRWILRDVSFGIRAGECAGISAPSGFGKTTLLKVLVGLLQPAGGECRYDGCKMRPENVHALRRQFGIVMQQDQLLAGTLAQNIAAFDDAPDDARIVRAAKIACVHTDILALPMRYLTLVGDMGDVFSGGQKQRILLARALYRAPRILFLDEATSSLDSDSENRIVAALSQLPMTRIVIAHRRETLAMCERIIDLALLNSCSRDRVSTLG